MNELTLGSDQLGFYCVFCSGFLWEMEKHTWATYLRGFFFMKQCTNSVINQPIWKVRRGLNALKLVMAQKKNTNQMVSSYQQPHS